MKMMTLTFLLFLLAHGKGIDEKPNRLPQADAVKNKAQKAVSGPE